MAEQSCPRCGGDCSAANPPVIHCPMTDSGTGRFEGAGLSDASFHPPTGEASAGRLATGHVVLDLPVPPSVNKTRRINWAAPYSRWVTAADNMLLAVKYHPTIALRRFELHITFSEVHTKMDLDNGLKALIDYLKRIEAIADDAPANLRRLVVEWGEAPAGVRVVIKGAA